MILAFNCIAQVRAVADNVCWSAAIPERVSGPCCRFAWTIRSAALKNTVESNPLLKAE